jgi:hypothetical protein
MEGLLLIDQDLARMIIPKDAILSTSICQVKPFEGCVLCEYMEECRSEANASYDLSRIPYITSESKRHLRAAGFRTHQDLAALDPALQHAEIEQLRVLSHDLSTNLPRYIAAAQALQDGMPRTLEKSTFQMPQYEDVRIVLSAEQDGVTGTCFALGIKTFEGWDSALNRPVVRSMCSSPSTRMMKSASCCHSYRPSTGCWSASTRRTRPSAPSRSMLIHRLSLPLSR